MYIFNSSKENDTIKKMYELNKNSDIFELTQWQEKFIKSCFSMYQRGHDLSHKQLNTIDQVYDLVNSAVLRCGEYYEYSHPNKLFFTFNIYERYHYA